MKPRLWLCRLITQVALESNKPCCRKATGLVSGERCQAEEASINNEIQFVLKLMGREREKAERLPVSASYLGEDVTLINDKIQLSFDIYLCSNGWEGRGEEEVKERGIGLRICGRKQKRRQGEGRLYQLPLLGGKETGRRETLPLLGGKDTGRRETLPLLGKGDREKGDFTFARGKETGKKGDFTLARKRRQGEGRLYPC